MMRSVKLLTWLSLSNFLGFNEARYSKDKKKKSRLWTMVAAYVLLGAMLVFYTGLIAYGLILSGMITILPMYLVVVISLLAFMFTVFRAGPELFSIKTYEMLIVLPVKPAAIVISRFLTLYLIDMVISVITTATVLTVCAFTASLSPLFYILMAVGAFFLPLLPMTLAMIVGTAIYAVTSRMRHKNLMQILFSFAFLALYFVFIQNINEDIDVMMNALMGMMQSVKNFYPPAVWFSEGVQGDILMYLLFFAVSLVVFFAFAFLVGKCFKTLCTSLISQSAKRNYTMKEEKSKSSLGACFFRERKRYFSSAVYVMNTAIGYLMLVVLSAFFVFGDTKAMFSLLPADMVAAFVPFGIALFANLSPTTISSFSMEGKCFWLTQTLPLRLKDIIHAKLLINLMFAVPSVLLSAILFAVTLRPSLFYLIFLILLPLIYVLFGTVLGLFLNIKMPTMIWDSEAQVVKQSKAVLLMMLFGFLTSLLPILAIVLIGLEYANWIILAMAVLLSAASIVLYRAIMKMHLNDLIQN